ncbi:MAG: hypothetical protein M3Y42_03300 [Actinomycetota bacterium]|nr:hypothetical protein [Actinomycetota bacterium]MDQ2955975.1 hypothetical protein [Actinomycetota bacterium]
MRKSSRFAGVISAAVACIAFVPVAAQAAPNITTWHLVGCAPTKYTGAQICLYYATGNQAQGRFINNSSQDIQNQGYFQMTSNGQDNYCGDVVTKHGTTSTCTRTLNGTWRLNDAYHYGSTVYTIFTASHTY